MRIEAHSQPLAIGLSWSLLPEENTKAEAARIAQDNGLVYGVIRGAGITSVGGQQVGLSVSAEQKGLPSAGAILAEQYASLIAGIGTPDGRVWLCVISGNQVISGGDIVVNEDQFRDKFKSFYADLSEHGVELDVFLDDAAAALVDVAPTLEGDDIDDLIDLDFMNEIKASVKIRRIYVNKKLVAGGAATLLAVGFVGYLIFGGSSEPEVAPADLNWAPPAPKEDPNARLLKEQQALEEAIAAAKEAERKWVSADMNGADEKALIASLIDTWTASPGDLRGGWLAQQMSWVLGTPGTVEITWKPAPGATSLMLREAFPDIDIAFDGSGTKAVSRHRIEVPGTDVDAVDLIDQTDVDAHVINHTLTYMGVDVQFEESAMLERKGSLPNVQGAPPGNDSLLGLSVLPFSFKGTSAASMATIIDNFDLMPTAVVESVSINPRNQSWVVSGVIYEN